MRGIGVAMALTLAVILAGCSMSPASVAPSTNTGGRMADGSKPAAAIAPSAPVAQSSGEAAGSAAQTSWDRYVIRSGELALVVKDVDATVTQVGQVAAGAGGFVSNSNLRRDATRVVADMTVQVPAENFDRAMDELKSLAVTVETSRTSTQDVTEEYVDNEAALRNLRASEESTRRLLEQTLKMEDIVTVQRELTRIRGEIEKIEGRQRYLDRRVDLSTINVHLATEAGVSLASARSEWQPLRTAQTAWEASLNFVSGALDLLLAILVFSWWLVPVVIGIVWFVRRRRRRPPARPPVTSEGAR